MTAAAATAAGLELVQRPLSGSKWVFVRVPPSVEEDLRLRICVEEVYAQSCHRVSSNFGMSAKEREFLNRPEHGGATSHVYGDTSVDLVLPLFRLLREGREIGASDSFIDFGSGDGKLTMLMRLLTPVSSSIGVELSPTRHSEATAAISRVREKLNHERQARGTIADVQLLCGSMLEYAGLADATLVFVYNLCLDVPFLRRLNAYLASQLPIGASVLVRGKKLPDDFADADPPHTTTQRRLELRLRLTMFYGYQVVEASAQPQATIMRPNLMQLVGTLGSTKFPHITFVEAPPDHVVTAAEIATW